MNERLKILIVGVGGQGALTVAKFLGEAAILEGLEVMVGQLHGMSQRGGSVECSVLIGPGKSSFIGDGQADIVLGLEPMEVLRALPKMSPQSRVIINRGVIMPFSLALQGLPYPPIASITEQVQEITPYVFEVDGPVLVRRIGVSRVLNVLMVGALTGLGMLPFDRNVLWKVIEKKSPERFKEANLQALGMGIEAVASKKPAIAVVMESKEATC